MAAMLNGARPISWIGGQLDLSAAEVVALAETVSGDRGPIFLPYLTGERSPLGDPHIRACFFGLEDSTTRADLCRSVVEAIAFCFADAAQSFGATHHGVKSCALSNVGSTSFFPSKPLGGYGDGGACFTHDADLAERMRSVRVHGQSARYQHTSFGINGRLDTIQAAILLEKLTLFPHEIQLREQVAARYAAGLSEFTRTPSVQAYNTSVFAQYTIEVSDREAVQKALSEHDVPTAVHYPVPLHKQPVFEAFYPEVQSFPHAEDAAKHVLSLPMHPYLTIEEQVKIVDAIKQAIN